ncbi:hypothetical protein LCGC14_3111400 [marine sediment metagenome]|uniref:Uncharacterized protein n=1 Tax=marine sediment metagenome TaxID=412755 RepID=A0A0F8W5B1_9ZZZZ
MVRVREAPDTLGLNREQLLEIYYKMLLSRAVGSGSEC